MVDRFVQNDFKFFFSDIYQTRCNGDDSRIKKFNMLVNKKCSNLARASKDFKPAARKVKKTDDVEDVEQVVVETNLEIGEVVKDEEL